MRSPRYLALCLFGLTVVKVFISDFAGLEGLQRVAAFIGVGILLLVVSYAYQRVAERVLGGRDPVADTSRQGS